MILSLILFKIIIRAMFSIFIKNNIIFHHKWKFMIANKMKIN